MAVCSFQMQAFGLFPPQAKLWRESVHFELIGTAFRTMYSGILRIISGPFPDSLMSLNPRTQTQGWSSLVLHPAFRISIYMIQPRPIGSWAYSTKPQTLVRPVQRCN